MIRWVASVALALLFGSPAAAQVVSGSASPHDGVTIELEGKRVHLYGITVPALGQQCVRTVAGAERPYPCGLSAKAFLASLLARRTVFCVPESENAADTSITAQCFADGADVSEVLVRAGWAVAADRLANIYVSAEEEARQAQRGLWAGRFDRPNAR